MLINWVLPEPIMTKLMESFRNGSVAEQQIAVLTGFSGTDSFKLTYAAAESALITRGTNYDAAGIKAAIEGIAGFPGTVTVSGVSDTAFIVTWNEGGARSSVFTVTTATGVTGVFGTTIEGEDQPEDDRVSFKGATMKLFSNDATVTPLTVLADLTECVFDGYSESPVIEWDESFFGAGGVCSIVGSLLQWMATGVTTLQTVYGGWLELDGEMLLCGKLETPVPISGIGSTVVVFPQVTFPPIAFQSAA